MSLPQSASTVPLLDVNAQNLPLESELTAAFRRVLHSGTFILGPEVEAFEREVASMLGVRHAIGVSSGTDAILLALMALDIKPGDEVLCPTYTFFATAGCIARIGAIPVFVDSCPVCFNLSVPDARRKVTSKTRAIIPVHLFGQSAEMDAVMGLAGEHGIRVIEDGAQALGAKFRGRACGTIGDFGTFSFFPSKNLGGFGDGGMLVCNDDDLAGKARILRAHGSKPKYFHKFIGGNFRLDALQAALLRVKLPHYADYTRRRQANAAFYTSELSKIPGVAIASPADCRCASDAPPALPDPDQRIILPCALPHNEHIWNQFTIRITRGRRDALKDFLAVNGIGSEIYYPVTMDRQECFSGTPAASRHGCQFARHLAQEAISIAIYPELSDANKREVVVALAAFAA